MNPQAPARRRFHTATNHRRRPLVSLTPLIDVVFILLLFFMLASSFLDLRAIPLGAPAQAGGVPSVEGALLVEIRPEGVRYGGSFVGLDRLADLVRAQLRDKPNRRVLVRPADGVNLQNTVAVLDTLSVAGAQNLSLVGRGQSGVR